MTNKEKDLIFRNLIKIEHGIAKIYNHFSLKSDYSNPVKNFWRNISNEEELHADMFDEIRQGVIDGSVQATVNIDMADLGGFVEKINTQLKNIQSKNLDESSAYSFGAIIEAELDEAKFLQMVKTNEPKFVKMLNKIENDTKKHRVLLINHAKGIK